MEEKTLVLNRKINKFSLKNENEDNLIEYDSKEDKESSNNSDFFQYRKKYKIKYAQILKNCIQKDRPEYNYENEFYCNLLLMPSIMDFSDKLSTLSMISYCYQVRENCNLTYLISHKFEKNIQYINNIKENNLLKVFCRTAFFLQKQKNVFYAFKYILKCNDLINKNSLLERNRKTIDKYFEQMKNDLLNYIKNKEEQFKDKEIIPETKLIEIKELIDLIFSNKNNLDLNDENNNYIYAISKDWLIKLKLFIEPYLNNVEDKNEYIEEVFNNDYVYKYYFDEKVENSIKTICPYPGPINNFPLISFKDCWIDKDNPDENIFLKKNVELNKDYYFVNYKDWDLLNSIFDNTNEIKRKKNNLDLIQLKFILYDKRIRVKNCNTNLLKQKYIQINKNSSVKQLKDKILNCVNNELKGFNDKNEQEVCFYILNKDKKDILIEMTLAFVIRIQMYESLYIKKLELQENNTLNDFLIKFDRTKNILIIEIFKKCDINFFIQIDNDYKCSECGKHINNLKEKYNCELCHFSLFCCRKCSNKYNGHLDLDNQLRELFEEKFVLLDLLSLDLNTLWINGQNIGRIGLNNVGSTCYINSVIQCLSNTRDLTKYFLSESFKKEINGSKGEISEAYYELIKQLWNGYKDEYVNTRPFKKTFCNHTKLFCNEEQQDAYDFLNALLENLHDELNRVTKKPNIELEEQKEGESDEVTSSKWWDLYKSKDDSIIVDLFKGQYKITNKCSGCGHESITFDQFLTLDLPIPQKKSQIQIKFFTNSGNYIDLNIKLDDKTQMKDIILKSIIYLDKKNYTEIAKKINIEGHLFNYNIENVPDSILYNNIQIIEFNKDLKMLNIFNTNYNNINIIKKNKEIPFDNLNYIEFTKKRSNSEIVLFEKDINSNLDNYIDVYVYPFGEFERENMLFNIVKVEKIVSFPVIISIKKNDNLKNLKLLIFKKLNKILENQARNYLDAIEICFPHFNDKWNIFKIKEGICPICKKAYDKNKFCLLFDSIQKNATILNLINNMDKDRPLILFAKSSFYNSNLSLYKGIPLFFDKKYEIESKPNLSLYDALDALNSNDSDDNINYCKKCKNKLEKKIELYKTPLYLIIHLNRFKQKSNNKSKLSNKNDTFIEYKEILNLKDFVVGLNKEKSLYDLYGVVLHSKFMNFYNRFISYCKNYGFWFSYDDTNVNKLDDPINKDAYLLFYKKRYFV